MSFWETIFFLAVVIPTLILPSALAWAWLRRGFPPPASDGKPQTGAAPTTGGVPPSIRLERRDHIEWTHEAERARHAGDLQACGFFSAGEYGIVELPQFKVNAWVCPSRQAYAILYEHPNLGLWLDIVSRTVNGDDLTVTTATMGSELSKPPFTRKIYDRHSDVTALFGRVLAERGEGPFRTVSAASFPGEFETAYAREIQWRRTQ